VKSCTFSREFGWSLP